jgi:hypothetical protein
MAQINQDFDRLKQKYQPALKLTQQVQVQVQVQVQNMGMKGTKLFIRGVVPSVEVKKRIWDQIKQIDPTFSDLVCDISVSQQPRQPVAQASAGCHDRRGIGERWPRPAALYRQTGRYSLQNQQPVLWGLQSVHENIQRR